MRAVECAACRWPMRASLMRTSAAVVEHQRLVVAAELLVALPVAAPDALCPRTGALR